MSARHPTMLLRPGALRNRRFRRARHGVVALLAVWMLVIFLLMTAWVLNYNFLVLVNRNMQQKCDAIALAAAPALLDEDLLRDYPGPAIPYQTDDFAEAVTIAEQYRQWNNQGQAKAFEVRSDDMQVQSGFVPDISGCTPYQFDTSIPLDEPFPLHNTLRVRSQRPAKGNHPVRFVLDLFHGGSGRRAADVSSSGCATLDNLLVGFKPRPTAASPVMPLGIDLAAWKTERSGGSDGNANQIREIVLRLDTPDPEASDANAALLFFDDTLDVSVLRPQMALGLFPEDLPPDGTLGPVTDAMPLSVLAMRRVDLGAYPNLNAELALLLNDLAKDGEAQRVFPVYESFADANQDGVGSVRLVGFVAASVLFAGVVDDRLTVTVEPCFIIHHTAWTVGADHPCEPQRNRYVHKLRLSR